MTPLDAVFWETHWREMLEAAPTRRRERGAPGNRMKRWNAMAADFADRTSLSEQEAQRRSTIAQLMTDGILRPGGRVLDIGAGPGNWALRLAQTSGNVIALEPAEAMAGILEERIAAGGVTNITVDRRTWQEIDLGLEQWEGAFDLVFASMTPGIDGPDNLKKMMAASRGACYLSKFSGGKGGPQRYGELWQAVFDEPHDLRAGDIIYPFNLVYALGHRPRLEFHTWERETRLPRDKAIDDCCTYLEGYTELDDTIRATVAAFVDARCTDGVFHQGHEACQGIMVWRVDAKVHAV
jgi:SAM-dependent methyltransferase